MNWHAKCEKLEFYNDEKEYTEQPKRPPKPHHYKYELEEEWNSRLLEWEAATGHEKVVKPKGNAMTQKYYTKRLLPFYISAIQEARERDPRNANKWLLQEDGDPSHGMRKHGLAQKLRDEYSIKNLSHPPQSPDLNPIEACWNILKQRVWRRKWDTLEELKGILQEE